MTTENVLLRILTEEPELALDENHNSLVFRFWELELKKFQPLGIEIVKTLTPVETILRCLRQLKHSSDWVKIELKLAEIKDKECLWH